MLRVGFVALTDAAPVIMGVEGGFYRAHGVTVELHKQVSWPAIRDGLLDGSLDAAHCLASLPLSLAAGITGRPGERLTTVMILNTDGQAVTLSGRFAATEFATPADGLRAIAAEAASRRLTLAMTYPGGTHDIWLRYWLAAAGVDLRSLDIIPIPPAQMVANLRGGTMDGFSAGEPWNALAVEEGIGFTAIRSSEILPCHPEKAIVVSPTVLERRRDELAAFIAGTLATCRWLDDTDNRKRSAPVLASRRYVNVASPIIESRLLGRYARGGGLPAEEPSVGQIRFHADGAVNAPRRAHALWFLAQFARLELTQQVVDPMGIVDSVIDRDLYSSVARSLDVPVSDDDMEPFATPLDGSVFEPFALVARR